LIEAMSFFAPPVLPDTIGKDDQVRLEIKAINGDLAEGVVVDFPGNNRSLGQKVFYVITIQ